MKREIQIHGTGSYLFSCASEKITDLIRNPREFAACMSLVNSFSADGNEFKVVVRVGQGLFRSDYAVRVVLREADQCTFVMRGNCKGSGLKAQSSGLIRLHKKGTQTLVDWEFTGLVGGTLSIAGSRFISGMAMVFINRVMQSANTYLINIESKNKL